MIYHLSSKSLRLGGFSTVLKLMFSESGLFEVHDIDHRDELTITQIGCVTGYGPNFSLNAELLRIGLDQLILAFDDGERPYDIYWRKLGWGFDDAVEAMLEHTVVAAGYDVFILEN